MLILNSVLGSIDDEVFSDKIHTLSHSDKIEFIKLDPVDLARKKFKAYTTAGRSCAVSVSRDTVLENGSILCIEDDFAIVLKTNEVKWLKIKPHNINAAIELGYFAGNMHWQVRFSDHYLFIALNSSKESYLNRLSNLISNHSIEIIENDG
ncbi:MAG: urease accessory protein UreE [Pseudomonadota bacterium]